jgi:hypothetical protein
MSLKKITIGLTLAVSFSASAFNNGLYFHKQSLQLKSDDKNLQHLKLRVDGTLRTQETAFFDQKLNHKSASSKTTFKQRYFVDSKYAVDANSPVFLIICGEWNCGGTGSYSYIEALAKSMKGHLVALEHRFYGESMPTNKLTTAALKTLSLESAIEDLASFQRFMMNDKGLKGKWVAAGGSYAGTLSAFYRLKHPELVVGSLASSGPVLMKNEFFEYDAHIAKVINKTTCGDKVREAVKAIEEKMATPEGAKAVKETFQATNVVNDKDFLYVVADMLAAAVQYGRDKVFCSALTSSQDLIAGYAKGGLSVLGSMGTTPFEISLAVAEKQEVTADDNMRQWMYQSCRQFGWFQVANGKGTETSRSSQIDLAYHEEVCDRLYKIPMGTDGALNDKWYDLLFAQATSNIIWTNGSNDPWQTLSVTEVTDRSNSGFDLFMMDGAAHCNDLRIGTIPSVGIAQKKMEVIISNWLK